MVGRRIYELLVHTERAAADASASVDRHILRGHDTLAQLPLADNSGQVGKARGLVKWAADPLRARRGAELYVRGQVRQTWQTQAETIGFDLGNAEIDCHCRAPGPGWR